MNILLSEIFVMFLEERCLARHLSLYGVGIAIFI